MKGNVIGFDAGSNTGAIGGADGRRYDFTRFDWHGQEAPRHDAVVDFVPQGERATAVYPLAPEYVPPTLGQFYFSLRGRISRTQYWLRLFLPLLAIGFVLNLLQTVGIEGAGTVSRLFILLMLWPFTAVLVKRIHDRNKSGALVWVFYGPLLIAIVMTVIAIIGAVVSSGDAGLLGFVSGALWLTVVGIGIWFFIEFGCMRGTTGPNRFGPDPVVEH